MVLFRFTLTFYGEAFAPEPFVAGLQALGAEVDWCAESNEQVSMPYLEVSPAQQFSTNPNANRHLQWFIDVLDAFYPAFQTAGAQESVLFTDVFYERGQCNMELFSPAFYACAHRCSLATPLSAHRLPKAEWLKLERQSKDNYALQGESHA